MQDASRRFDYIVVGAGAAGCVIANRLSADPAIRVALIEAGPSDRQFPVNWKTTLPIGNIFLLPHARYNWQHVFEGGPGVNDRQIACPRGRLLGGCTSVNGTVYIRGNRRDYDDWATRGNEGWRFADVLPWFVKHENRAGPPSPLHGRGGELDVQQLRSSNPLSRAFVAAAAEAGHARSDDFNGAENRWCWHRTRFVASPPTWSRRRPRRSTATTGQCPNRCSSPCARWACSASRFPNATAAAGPTIATTP